MMYPSELRELARRIDGRYTVESLVTEESMQSAVAEAADNAQRDAARAAYDAIHPAKNAPDEDTRPEREPETVERDHITGHERALIVAALHLAAEQVELLALL